MAEKFLTIRLRGAQWKRQLQEPKNAGSLWKLGQAKTHLLHPTPSHGKQSGEALGSRLARPPLASPLRPLGLLSFPEMFN